MDLKSEKGRTLYSNFHELFMFVKIYHGKADWTKFIILSASGNATDVGDKPWVNTTIIKVVVYYYGISVCYLLMYLLVKYMKTPCLNCWKNRKSYF